MNLKENQNKHDTDGGGGGGGNSDSKVSIFPNKEVQEQKVTMGSTQTMRTCHFPSVSMETSKRLETELTKLLIVQNYIQPHVTFKP